MSVQIHPSAIVAKEAKLGENVKIDPYCIVDPKVEIGDGSELRAFSRVCDYTRMGAGCVIHEHAVIGGLPQDLSGISRAIGDSNGLCTSHGWHQFLVEKLCIKSDCILIERHVNDLLCDRAVVTARQPAFLR